MRERQDGLGAVRLLRYEYLGIYVYIDRDLGGRPGWKREIGDIKEKRNTYNMYSQEASPYLLKRSHIMLV